MMLVIPLVVLCFTLVTGIEITYSKDGFCRFGLMSRRDLISMSECLPEEGVFSYMGSRGVRCYYHVAQRRSTCRSVGNDVLEKSVFVCRSRNGRDPVDDDCADSDKEVILREEVSIKNPLGVKVELPSDDPDKVAENKEPVELADADITSGSSSGTSCTKILETLNEIKIDIRELKSQSKNQGSQDEGRNVDLSLAAEVIALGQPTFPFA